MSFVTGDNPKYSEVLAFRQTVKSKGLRWLEDTHGMAAKTTYSFLFNVSMLLYEHDNEIDLDNFEIKDQCMQYISEHPKLGDLEWRTLISGDEYLKKHNEDEDSCLCDDLLILAFAYTFEQPLRLFEGDRVIGVTPEGNGADKEPLLIGKVSDRHFAALMVDEENRGKVPSPDFDEKFVLDRDTLKKEKLSKKKKVTSIRTPEKRPSVDRRNPTTNILQEQEKLIDEKMKQGYNPQDEEDTDDERNPGDIGEIEPREDEDRTGGTIMKLLTKIFKLFSYFIFFGLVFFGALVSKSCILVLANGAKPRNHDDTDNPSNSKEQQDYIRVWSYIFILIALLFPEGITIVYSIYRIILKKKENLDFYTLIWGVFWEIPHALGVSIIFLIVMPHMDSTMVTILFSTVGFVPSIINLHAKWASFSSSNRKDLGHRRRIIHLLMSFGAVILLLLAFALFICLCLDVLTLGGDEDTSYPFEPVDDKTSLMIWAVVGVVLISFRYWENFITTNFEINLICTKITFGTLKLHENMERCRFKMSLVNSFVKSGILIGITFLTIDTIEGTTYLNSNHKFGSAVFDENFFNKAKKSPLPYKEITNKLFLVLITQAFCSLGAFFFGRTACMTMAQINSYSLPLTLVTPVQAILSAVLTWYKNNPDKHPGQDSLGLWSFMKLTDPHTDLPFISMYIDWNTSLKATDNLTIYLPMVIGVIIVQGSIILLTVYLWSPEQAKIERTEVLFVKAIYAGPLIDQTLMLNRRNYHDNYFVFEEKSEKIKQQKERRKSMGRRESTIKKQRRLTKTNKKKSTPHLYMCTTMWHETEQEMTQILTSLMRMDVDEARRRPKKESECQKYTFNVHVLFDDAFELIKGTNKKTPNKFVNQLCKLVPVAANKVTYQSGYSLPPPVVYPTPYGARLEFLLPNNNMMFVHLKDKDKIRHRKRWSQCMYMYYILGFLHTTKKLKNLDDIYILALDGDVDFQPNSVLTLVDRMLRNSDVGAACGRIHPVGSGPVVWFQKFEYAVGHWLQKTTEHVLGCVLCSPGCFSMFRGRALMDVNVVKTYTTKATEALHYVQWDQGEDRWLCTLLLKQGWRIEYSAASDSFTFAPEDFKEFYNQRRRWGPSTMANVIDILNDSRITVKNNNYISWGYVVYQTSLLVSSILGPATVVMMVSQSFTYIFSWTATVGLIVSLVPVIIYIILCYTTSQNTQVAVAAILTIVYALVMMTVLVGVVGSMASSTLLDPNNLFYVVLAGLYFFTAVLHPQELSCLFHAPLYYLCVPSAFIFLMVYSLNNMDNVSWGTREVRSAAPEAPVEETPEKVAENIAKEQQGFKMMMPGKADIYASHDSDSYYKCGLGNLCQCVMCMTPSQHQYAYMPISNPQDQPTAEQQARKRTVTTFNRRKTKTKEQMIEDFSNAKAQNMGEDADKIKRRLSRNITAKQAQKLNNESELTTGKLRRLSRQTRDSTMTRRLTKTIEMSKEAEEEARNNALNLHKELENDNDSLNSDEYRDIEEMYDEFTDDEDMDDERKNIEEKESISWILDGELETCQIDYIDDEELKFWKYIIERYLYPLDENADEKQRIAGDLKALRNKVTGAYYFANALWLVLNFALQLAIQDVAIAIVIQGQVIKLNPVSLIFLGFFVVVLFVQFFCMIAHRWSTTLHVLATTNLQWNDENGIGTIKNLTNLEVFRGEKENEKKKKQKRLHGQHSDPFGGVNENQREENDDEDQEENIEYKRAYNHTNLAYTNGAFIEDDTDSGNISLETKPMAAFGNDVVVHQPGFLPSISPASSTRSKRNLRQSVAIKNEMFEMKDETVAPKPPSPQLTKRKSSTRSKTPPQTPPPTKSGVKWEDDALLTKDDETIF